MSEERALRLEVESLRLALRQSNESVAQLAARVEGFAIVLEDLADYVVADEQEKRSMEEQRKRDAIQRSLVASAEKRGGADWRKKARERFK